MQNVCVYCIGIYIGVIGNDDFMYVVQVVSYIVSRQWRCVFRFSFYVLYMMSCCFNIIFFFYFAGFQQNSRDNEGDSYCCIYICDVSEVSIFWCYCQYSKDRIWRCWRNQIIVQDSQCEYVSYIVEDDCEDQMWIYQYIWEVDFVDIIQEVDDCCIVCRLFSVIMIKEYVCQQYVYIWIWVSFNQEED